MPSAVRFGSWPCKNVNPNFLLGGGTSASAECKLVREGSPYRDLANRSPLDHALQVGASGRGASVYGRRSLKWKPPAGTTSRNVMSFRPSGSGIGSSNSRCGFLSATAAVPKFGSVTV